LDYQTRLRGHLFQYKEYNLGICAKQFDSAPDALPADLRELNILARCRKPFRHMARINPLFHLQADFHCLASSQALCFNLFFPFLQQPKHWNGLLSILGCEAEEVERTEFDYSFGRSPEETFSFHFSSVGGRQFFFDIKLAESCFGPSCQSAACSEPSVTCLRHDIVGLVSGSLLKSDDVAGLMVLLKKLAFAAGMADSRMICIYPRANLKLTQDMKILQDALYATIKAKLQIVYLEDLIGALLTVFRYDSSELCVHFKNLRQKYVVP